MVKPSHLGAKVLYIYISTPVLNGRALRSVVLLLVLVLVIVKVESCQYVISNKSGLEKV